MIFKDRASQTIFTMFVLFIVICLTKATLLNFTAGSFLTMIVIWLFVGFLVHNTFSK
jgi:hypothetical protein